MNNDIRIIEKSELEKLIIDSSLLEHVLEHYGITRYCFSDYINKFKYYTLPELLNTYCRLISYTNNDINSNNSWEEFVKANK